MCSIQRRRFEKYGESEIVRIPMMSHTFFTRILLTTILVIFLCFQILILQKNIF